jgi:hypothetical protein
MTDEEKDAIRGGELADEAGPTQDEPKKDAGDPADAELAEGGIRGDGLAEGADG